jgi:hypothetical protein
MMNENLARDVLGFIFKSFTIRQGVYEEGLMAASALALAYGQQFDQYVKEFGSYLVFSLNSVKDTSLCRTAIHSTSDLIRAIGNNFSQYIDQILPLIINILAVKFIFY